jgi:hypothetical protein
MVVDQTNGDRQGRYQPRHRVTSRPGGSRARSGDEGVESNSRLTGSAAAVLLVLFAVEGLTLLQVRSLLKIHVFVGMLLIPPVLVKMGSTGWRFAKYYTGAPPYRRKGPPHVILRLLGPFVVILSVVLLGSGVALVLDPKGLGSQLLFVHKASFVLWFGAMTIHVIGHIAETAKLAPLDLARRTRSQVRGASARQWTLLSSLVAGVVLGLAMLGPTVTYLSHHQFFGH